MREKPIVQKDMNILLKTRIEVNTMIDNAESATDYTARQSQRDLRSQDMESTHWKPRPPFKHQTAALLKGWDKPGFAYLLEYGTGKSRTLVDNIAMLVESAQLDRVLILAGKGSYRDWVTYKDSVGHLERDLPPTLLRDAAICLWQGSDTKTKRTQLQGFLNEEAKLKILVMNIEAVATAKSAYTVAYKHLRSGKVRMVVVDESTMIKHEDSQRSQHITWLRDKCSVQYRRILTGGPITNSPLDLWSQFNWIMPKSLGYDSYYPFRHRYCALEQKVIGRKWNDAKNQWDLETIDAVAVDRFGVPIYQNIDELQARIDRISFRALKKDCLDLPPKIYQKRLVEITPEQKNAYYEMREHCFLELEGAVASPTLVLTKLLMLHQIVCGFIKTDQGEKKIKNNRINCLMETLEEISGSVVIWANYRRNVEDIVAAINKRYGDGSCVRYTGSTTDAERDEAKYKFQEGTARFLVGTQQTGGRGLQLTAANTVIYYSNNYDLELRLNSEDRIHRIGQTLPCNYIDLVVEGTVDEKIIFALRNSINIASVILNDGWREWLI